MRLLRFEHPIVACRVISGTETRLVYEVPTPEADVDNWLDLAAAELARAQGTDLPSSAPSLAHQLSARSEEPAAESGAITEVRPTSSRALLVLGALVVLGVLAYALFG